VPRENSILQAIHQGPATVLGTVITCFWNAADEQTRDQATTNMAPKADLPGNYDLASS